MPLTSPRSAFLFATLLLPATAQSTFVAPAGFGYESKPGAGFDFAPFGGFAGHSQQLILFSKLGFSSGTISSIAFRRDSTTNHYSPLTENVTVRLGYSDYLPVGMPVSFELTPKGTLQQVFSGNVNLPDAPPGNGPHPWSVAIVAQQPFAFSNSPGNGQSLVLDVESNAASQNSWGRDAHRIAGDATLPSFGPRGGPGCNGSNGRPVSVLLNPRHSGVPGRVMSLQARGFAAQVNFAISFIGINTSPPYPIDLTPLGMTNCMLHADVFLSQSVPTVPALNGTRDAQSHWAVPDWPILAGVRIVNQWYAIDLGANAASVITSSALDVYLGKAGVNSYATQSIWTVAGNTVPSQFPDDFGAIVRFGGTLQ